MLNDTEAYHRLVDLAAKLYSRTGVEFELPKTKDTESRTEKISYTAARENESTEDLHIESVSENMITSPDGNVKVFIATKKRLFSLFFCNFKACQTP